LRRGRDHSDRPDKAGMPCPEMTEAGGISPPDFLSATRSKRGNIVGNGGSL
jgi:hypothetical protein